MDCLKVPNRRAFDQQLLVKRARTGKTSAPNHDSTIVRSSASSQRVPGVADYPSDADTVCQVSFQRPWELFPADAVDIAWHHSKRAAPARNCLRRAFANI